MSTQDALLLSALHTCLEATLDTYVQLAGSGDCGNWDPETEPHVIAARAVLARAEREAQP